MTKECYTIMWGEGPRNCGREFCLSSGSMLSKCLCTEVVQADRTTKNPSILDLRLELASQLIGSFCGKSRVGCSVTCGCTT